MTLKEDMGELIPEFIHFSNKFSFSTTCINFLLKISLSFFNCFIYLYLFFNLKISSLLLFELASKDLLIYFSKSFGASLDNTTFFEIISFLTEVNFSPIPLFIPDNILLINYILPILFFKFKIFIIFFFSSFFEFSTLLSSGVCSTLSGSPIFLICFMSFGFMFYSYYMTLFYSLYYLFDYLIYFSFFSNIFIVYNLINN